MQVSSAYFKVRPALRYRAVLAAWQGLVRPQSFLAKRCNDRSRLLHPEMRFLDFLS
jgi:hypothetical protein